MSATTQRIGPAMTVREVNLKHPACGAVFARYGMGGCGGRYGPPEPLGLFAESHHVPLDQLIQELEKVAQDDPMAEKDPEEKEEETSEDEGKLFRLCRRFVAAAILITLSFGTVWGVILLTKIALGQSFQAPGYANVQAHGHAQLFGWVGLFIMGIAYYVLPKFKDVPVSPFQYRLAHASLGLMASGILLRAVVQPLADRVLFAGLDVLSAVLELAAVVLFTLGSLQLFFRSAHRPELYDRYILAGLVWFLGVTGMNLTLITAVSLRLATTIEGPWNDAFLHAAVYGFVANMIFGVSYRIVPNFLGLRQPMEKTGSIAFWLFNLGVLLRVLTPAPAVIASLLEAMGIVLVLVSLGLFTRPVVKLSIPGVSQAFGWFIKAGYGWLLAAGLMVLGGDVYTLVTGQLLPHAYVGSYRHAITVGFITSVMLGVAYRILPIFNGTELHSPRLMQISFFLLFIGNALRVLFQVGTLALGDWTYALVGTSGYLELGALALFGWNLFQTIREGSEEDFIESRSVSGNTKVADVLDAFPDVRPLLVKMGLEGLRGEGHHVPRFVTLDFAARRHGAEIDRVVGAVNDYLQQR